MIRKNYPLIIALCVILISSYHAEAQNWLLSGNAGTDSSLNFIGTTDNKGLKLKTNNATRLYISNTGNIGIGTSSPAYLLDIQKNANASMQFKSTNGNANILIDRSNSANSSSVNYRTNGVGLWQTGTTGGTDNFLINNVTLGSVGITILNSNNNVGIGTNSPTAKLEVAGQIKITGGTPGTGKVLTSDASGNGSWQTPASGGWGLNGNANTNSSNFIGTTDNVNFQIKTKNFVRMTVTAAGKVGIGSLLPVYKLDVNGGSINTDSLYRINGFQVVARDASGNIQLGDNSSRVGIGTSTPDALLSIYSEDLASFSMKSNSGSAKITLERATEDSSAMLELRTQSSGVVWKMGSPAGYSEDFILLSSFASQSPFRISKSTGNIGIKGAPSNNKALSIVGETEIDGELTTTGMQVNGILKVNGGAGSPDPGNVLTADASGDGTCSWQTPISGSGNSNRIAFWNDVLSLSSNDDLFWDNSNSRLGLGTTAPAFQLQLSLNSAAKPTSSAWTVPSDSRLKKNVSDFNEGLNVIEKIRPVWFEYTGEAGMPSDEKGIGTVAQEIQKIAPYMVKEWTYQNKNGESQNYLGVDYGAMDFILANAIKEQQLQLDEKEKSIKNLQSEIGGLQNENTELKSRLDKLEHDFLQNQTNNNSDVRGSNLENVVEKDLASLEQNIPNPFNQNTLIKFFIPRNTHDAVLKIYSMNDIELKSFRIVNKGQGEILIKGNSLSPGVYNYSLIVDNKIIETKQMVLSE